MSWAEADAHLRLSGDTEEQTYVEALIAAATSWAEQWCGIAIGAQTLEARLSRFTCPLRLRGPVTVIESVRYVATDGVETTLAAETYELAGDEVVLAFNQAWPSLRGDREGVRIRYSAGSTTTPEPIKAAILLMTGHLYRHREAVTAEKPAALPLGAEALLQGYRSWRV